MARLLIDRGYKNVRPLLGGFDAWTEMGLPVEKHSPAPTRGLTIAEQTTSS
jgi:3-mercaptopyruvate sulfurtransferase SseA